MYSIGKWNDNYFLLRTNFRYKMAGKVKTVVFKLKILVQFGDVC